MNIQGGINPYVSLCYKNASIAEGNVRRNGFWLEVMVVMVAGRMTLMGVQKYTRGNSLISFHLYIFNV